MRNNHNDHGRRLAFLEKVYLEDRKRWRQVWEALNRQERQLRRHSDQIDRTLDEVKRQGDDLKRQGDRLEGVVRRLYRKSEFSPEENP